MLSGDIIKFTFDADKHTLAVQVNSVDHGIIFNDIPGGVRPAVLFYGSTQDKKWKINSMTHELRSIEERGPVLGAVASDPVVELSKIHLLTGIIPGSLYQVTFDQLYLQCDQLLLGGASLSCINSHDALEQLVHLISNRIDSTSFESISSDFSDLSTFSSGAAVLIALAIMELSSSKFLLIVMKLMVLSTTAAFSTIKIKGLEPFLAWLLGTENSDMIDAWNQAETLYEQCTVLVRIMVLFDKIFVIQSIAELELLVILIEEFQIGINCKTAILNFISKNLSRLTLYVPAAKQVSMLCCFGRDLKRTALTLRQRLENILKSIVFSRETTVVDGVEASGSLSTPAMLTRVAVDLYSTHLAPSPVTQFKLIRRSMRQSDTNDLERAFVLKLLERPSTELLELMQRAGDEVGADEGKIAHKVLLSDLYLVFCLYFSGNFLVSLIDLADKVLWSDAGSEEAGIHSILVPIVLRTISADVDNLLYAIESDQSDVEYVFRKLCSILSQLLASTELFLNSFIGSCRARNTACGLQFPECSDSSSSNINSDSGPMLHNPLDIGLDLISNPARSSPAPGGPSVGSDLNREAIRLDSLSRNKFDSSHVGYLIPFFLTSFATLLDSPDLLKHESIVAVVESDLHARFMKLRSLLNQLGEIELQGTFLAQSNWPKMLQNALLEATASMFKQSIVSSKGLLCSESTREIAFKKIVNCLTPVDDNRGLDCSVYMLVHGTQFPKQSFFPAPKCIEGHDLIHSDIILPQSQYCHRCKTSIFYQVGYSECNKCEYILCKECSTSRVSLDSAISSLTTLSLVAAGEIAAQSIEIQQNHFIARFCDFSIRRYITNISNRNESSIGIVASLALAFRFLLLRLNDKDFATEIQNEQRFSQFQSEYLLPLLKFVELVLCACCDIDCTKPTPISGVSTPVSIACLFTAANASSIFESMLSLFPWLLRSVFYQDRINRCLFCCHALILNDFDYFKSLSTLVVANSKLCLTNVSQLQSLWAPMQSSSAQRPIDARYATASIVAEQIALSEYICIIKGVVLSDPKELGCTVYAPQPSQLNTIVCKTCSFSISMFVWKPANVSADGYISIQSISAAAYSTKRPYHFVLCFQSGLLALKLHPGGEFVQSESSANEGITLTSHDYGAFPTQRWVQVTYSFDMNTRQIALIVDNTEVGALKLDHAAFESILDWGKDRKLSAMPSVFYFGQLVAQPVDIARLTGRAAMCAVCNVVCVSSAINSAASTSMHYIRDLAVLGTTMQHALVPIENGITRGSTARRNLVEGGESNESTLLEYSFSQGNVCKLSRSSFFPRTAFLRTLQLIPSFYDEMGTIKINDSSTNQLSNSWNFEISGSMECCAETPLLASIGLLILPQYNISTLHSRGTSIRFGMDDYTLGLCSNLMTEDSRFESNILTTNCCSRNSEFVCSTGDHCKIPLLISGDRIYLSINGSTGSVTLRLIRGISSWEKTWDRVIGVSDEVHIGATLLPGASITVTCGELPLLLNSTGHRAVPAMNGAACCGCVLEQEQTDTAGSPTPLTGILARSKPRSVCGDRNGAILCRACSAGDLIHKDLRAISLAPGPSGSRLFYCRQELAPDHNLSTVDQSSPAESIDKPNQHEEELELEICLPVLSKQCKNCLSIEAAWNRSISVVIEWDVAASLPSPGFGLEPSHAWTQSLISNAGGDVCLNGTMMSSYTVPKRYCGRIVGIENLPGSDGQCGPHNGPSCIDCLRRMIQLDWFSSESFVCLPMLSHLHLLDRNNSRSSLARNLSLLMRIIDMQDECIPTDDKTLMRLLPQELLISIIDYSFQGTSSCLRAAANAFVCKVLPKLSAEYFYSTLARSTLLQDLFAMNVHARTDGSSTLPSSSVAFSSAILYTLSPGSEFWMFVLYNIGIYSNPLGPTLGKITDDVPLMDDSQYSLGYVCHPSSAAMQQQLMKLLQSGYRCNNNGDSQFLADIFAACELVHQSIPHVLSRVAISLSSVASVTSSESVLYNTLLGILFSWGCSHRLPATVGVRVSCPRSLLQTATDISNTFSDTVPPKWTCPNCDKVNNIDGFLVLPRDCSWCLQPFKDPGLEWDCSACTRTNSIIFPVCQTCTLRRDFSIHNLVPTKSSTQLIDVSVVGLSSYDLAGNFVDVAGTDENGDCLVGTIQCSQLSRPLVRYDEASLFSPETKKDFVSVAHCYTQDKDQQGQPRSGRKLKLEYIQALILDMASQLIGNHSVSDIRESIATTKYVPKTIQQTIETPHPYIEEMSESHDLEFPGASEITIVFDPQSKTSKDTDYVKFYKDAKKSSIWGENKYCLDKFPGVGDNPPLVIPADSFHWEFCSGRKLHTSIIRCNKN